ncbi:hypothetical protein R6Z07F_018551 [Ovis aries]
MPDHLGVSSQTPLPKGLRVPNQKTELTPTSQAYLPPYPPAANSSRGLARRQPKQKDRDRAPGAPRDWGLGPLLAPGNASSVIAQKLRGDVWVLAGGGRSPAYLEPTGRPTHRQGRLGPPAPRQNPETALPPRAGTAPLPPLTGPGAPPQARALGCLTLGGSRRQRTAF